MQVPGIRYAADRDIDSVFHTVPVIVEHIDPLIVVHFLRAASAAVEGNIKGISSGLICFPHSFLQETQFLSSVLQGVDCLLFTGVPLARNCICYHSDLFRETVFYFCVLHGFLQDGCHHNVSFPRCSRSGTGIDNERFLRAGTTRRQKQ